MIFRNPVITDTLGIDHGDPFVLKHGDIYYLYHTGRHAISLYTSLDLVNWEYRGAAIEAGGDDYWAQTDLWAPEVMYHQGTFYMYVAGARKQADGKADEHLRRQCLATATSPLGPFTWRKEPLVFWDWSIDGHPFQDTDGQYWFFYNIRSGATRYTDGTIGCGNVVERMLAPDQLERRPFPVTFPTERWEGNREGTWYWNEGPFVLKRRGIYYQMYSGGHFADETYGVGFATAPSPIGPWTKYAGNPILQSGANIKGPGHHCVVTGPDGVTPYVVYHGYIPGERGRKVHVDRLYWAGDRLQIAGPTDTEQPLPPGPVYDPAVPHWHLEAWSDGHSVTIAGISLDLPANAVHRLQAAGSGSTMRVLADGQLLYAGPCGQPAVAGDVSHAVLTSHLEDEALYHLPEGSSRVWAWGGDQPVEIALAVKGRATISAGSLSRVVESDGYDLICLQVDQATALAVKAGPGGAQVTDVGMTARPRS